MPNGREGAASRTIRESENLTFDMHLRRWQILRRSPYALEDFFVPGANPSRASSAGRAWHNVGRQAMATQVELANQGILTPVMQEIASQKELDREPFVSASPKVRSWWTWASSPTSTRQTAWTCWSKWADSKSRGLRSASWQRSNTNAPSSPMASSPGRGHRQGNGHGGHERRREGVPGGADFRIGRCVEK